MMFVFDDVFFIFSVSFCGKPEVSNMLIALLCRQGAPLVKYKTVPIWIIEDIIRRVNVASQETFFWLCEVQVLGMNEC